MTPEELEKEVSDELAKWFPDPVDIPCVYCGAAKAVIPIVEAEVRAKYEVKADESRLLTEVELSDYIDKLNKDDTFSYWIKDKPIWHIPVNAQDAKTASILKAEHELSFHADYLKFDAGVEAGRTLERAKIRAAIEGIENPHKVKGHIFGESLGDVWNES